MRHAGHAGHAGQVGQETPFLTGGDRQKDGVGLGRHCEKGKCWKTPQMQKKRLNKKYCQNNHSLGGEPAKRWRRIGEALAKRQNGIVKG